MRVYKQKAEQPLKWLFAVIIFCLVLGWAMTDVYGVDNGKNRISNDGQQSNGQTVQPDHRDPSPVPEPTTLALLALGLGGAAAYRKLKK